jgi:hypothetical protein
METDPSTLLKPPGAYKVYLLVLVILILSTTQTQEGFLVLVGTHPLKKCIISRSKNCDEQF